MCVASRSECYLWHRSVWVLLERLPTDSREERLSTFLALTYKAGIQEVMVIDYLAPVATPILEMIIELLPQLLLRLVEVRPCRFQYLNTIVLPLLLH